MKIKIPKRGLPISLIAPLALQWATNLGEDPEGLAIYIKNEVNHTLVQIQETKALPFDVWEAVAAFIQDLVYHLGGEEVVVVKLDDQSSYYLLYTSFFVLGKPKRYVISTRIHKDGSPPHTR